jgi:hypothetical protein
VDAVFPPELQAKPTAPSNRPSATNPKALDIRIANSIDKPIG